MNDDDVAHLRIERLQRRYADIATRGAYDRRAYDELAELATPDVRFRFTTAVGEFDVLGVKQFSEFSASATEGRFSFFEYVLLNFVFHLNADGTARGRTYAVEFTEDREHEDWNEYYGAYDDDYEFSDGTWRFARRHYHAVAVRTSGRLQAFALPPSYRPGGGGLSSR